MQESKRDRTVRERERDKERMRKRQRMRESGSTFGQRNAVVILQILVDVRLIRFYCRRDFSLVQLRRPKLFSPLSLSHSLFSVFRFNDTAFWIAITDASEF